ncbi:hypothetical protein ACJX0J_010357 [Zea mays]
MGGSQQFLKTKIAFYSEKLIWPESKMFFVVVAGRPLVLYLRIGLSGCLVIKFLQLLNSHSSVNVFLFPVYINRKMPFRIQRVLLLSIMNFAFPFLIHHTIVEVLTAERNGLFCLFSSKHVGWTRKTMLRAVASPILGLTRWLLSNMEVGLHIVLGVKAL